MKDKGERGDDFLSQRMDEVSRRCGEAGDEKRGIGGDIKVVLAGRRRRMAGRRKEGMKEEEEEESRYDGMRPQGGREGGREGGRRREVGKGLLHSRDMTH
jgi:hypothetical protein